MTEEELRGLEPGTWLRMRYGFDWVTFYVLSNTKQYSHFSFALID